MKLDSFNCVYYLGPKTVYLVEFIQGWTNFELGIPGYYLLIIAKYLNETYKILKKKGGVSRGSPLSND